jgi:hypothetical protein
MGKETPVHWDRIVSNIVDCMSLLEMKQRETGSNQHATKHQNINGRWMMKNITITPSLLEETTIKRDIVVGVQTNKTGTAALPYRVLCVYNKYYNKWYMDREPVVWKLGMNQVSEVVKKTTKGNNTKKQCRILGRLLKKQDLSGLWYSAEVNESTEADIVWRIFGEDDILDIVGNL